MVLYLKILFSAALLTTTVSAMQTVDIREIIIKERTTAQATNNETMLIFLNALKLAHKENTYIEIFSLNKEFISLANSLPEPLKSFAHERFNTTNLYI